MTWKSLDTTCTAARSPKVLARSHNDHLHSTPSSRYNRRCSGVERNRADGQPLVSGEANWERSWERRLASTWAALWKRLVGNLVTLEANLVENLVENLGENLGAGHLVE